MHASTIGVLCSVDYVTPPRYMYFRMDNAGGLKTPHIHPLDFQVSESPGGLFLTPAPLSLAFDVFGSTPNTP